VTQVLAALTNNIRGRITSTRYDNGQVRYWDQVGNEQENGKAGIKQNNAFAGPESKNEFIH